MPVSRTQLLHLRMVLKDRLPDGLAGSHIPLSIGLPNQAQPQIFYVRTQLTVNQVIAQVIDHESSGETTERSQYRLFTGQGKALSGETPIESLTGETLLLRPQTDRPLYLMVTADGRQFPIFKLPAIFGRYDPSNPTVDLALDLTGLDDKRTVSRQHVRLSQLDHGLIVENISKNNYVLVNGHDQILPGNVLAFAVGDQVQLGNVTLTLNMPES